MKTLLTSLTSSIKRFFSREGNLLSLTNNTKGSLRKLIIKFFILGSLLGFSAPGYGTVVGLGHWNGIISWIGLIPTFCLLWHLSNQKTSSWKMGIYGFAFGFGYHLIFMPWFLSLHPMTWLGLSDIESRLITIAAWVLIPVYSGLFLGGLFAIYNQIFQKATTWYILMAFPALWVATFLAMQITDIGIPWALIEYTQSGVFWLRKMSTVITVNGISYLLIFYNLSVALLLLRFKEKKPVQKMIGIIIPILIYTENSLQNHPPIELPIPVTTIQENLPIHLIKEKNLPVETIEKTYLTTLKETTIKPNSLIVLPEEGVIAHWVSTHDPLSNPQVNTLVQSAQEKNSHIIVGAASYKYDTLDHQKSYNSLILITPDGNIDFYHKRKLVPFGETSPGINGITSPNWMNTILEALKIDYHLGFDPGGEQKPLKLIENLGQAPLKLGSLICFELIYGKLSKQYKKQDVHLLVNSSNLGWFHGNPLMEEQFLAIGQMRAAENQIPLIISANTGVSAIIDANGTILGQIASNTKGVLSH